MSVAVTAAGRVPFPSPGTPASVPGWRERSLVAGIPALVSLALSLSTVGRHPYWQDSGVFLTAVDGLGVLYPPGFVLYEILCHAWTRLLFFLDFTLAVHLFSCACAALASGVMALAAQDLLRSTGRNLRIAFAEDRSLVGACAILAGVVQASGYTWWSAAIYAKGYALYFLIASLLMWRMIRAEESLRRADFTIVAALVGLAWQAHPSSALLGGILILFLSVHARELGARGVLGRLLLAAALSLGPTLLVLPILVGRSPWLMFGHPRTPGEYLRYALGLRFVGMHGVFGPDASRIGNFWRFAGEDLLGVGALLCALGLAVMVRRNVRLLVALLAWLLPYSLVTVLFKPEGQSDYWLVVARLPLILAVAAGAFHLLGPARRWAPRAAAALGLAAVVWSGLANYRDLNQRDYTLAELYGRIHLDTPDRNAIVLLAGDDANGLASYLQQVRGERPDLTLVTSSFLVPEAQGAGSWYEDELYRRSAFLRRPDARAAGARYAGVDRRTAATAAFLNANARGPRPLFTEVPVPPDLLDPAFRLVPAGIYWKLVPAVPKARPDLHYWNFPVEPEAIRPLYRRARAQDIRETPEGMSVKPQHYERRLAALLLHARVRLAMALADEGEFSRAAQLCQSVINYDDAEFESNPEVIHLLGISYYAAGEFDRALPALRRSSEISPRVESRATALFYLGDIARRHGDLAEAQRDVDQALALPGLDPAYLKEMEARLRRP